MATIDSKTPFNLAEKGPKPNFFIPPGLLSATDTLRQNSHDAALRLITSLHLTADRLEGKASVSKPNREPALSVGTEAAVLESAPSKKMPLFYQRGTFDLPETHVPHLTATEVDMEKAFKGQSWLEKKSHALLSGNPVATEPDLKGSMASYSTKTGIVTMPDGAKYFVIYNYPGSRQHREADTDCRRSWGEKAVKATEDTWRDIFVRRSLLPTSPSSDPRFVVLPFVPNIGLVDLLKNQHKAGFEGEYAYGKNYKTSEAKITLCQQMAKALEELHQLDLTFGEVIPSNMGLTPAGQVIIFDPETPYDPEVPVLEQKARDLFSLIISTCGSLHSSEHRLTDYQLVVEAILDNYSDSKVIQYVQENLSADLRLWKIITKPVAYAQFLVRTTCPGRRHYNKMMAAIRAYTSKE